MSAENDVASPVLLAQPQHALPTRTFLQVLDGLDGERATGAQRFDGLHTAEVATGEDLVDWLALQHVGQCLRLALARLRQRPQAIVAPPIGSVARLGVANPARGAHQGGALSSRVRVADPERGAIA